MDVDAIGSAAIFGLVAGLVGGIASVVLQIVFRAVHGVRDGLD